MKTLGMKTLGAGMAVAGLLWVTSASALTINFTYTHGSVTASGWLGMDLISGNQYHITSGSIAVDGDSYALAPAGFAVQNSPSGAFIVDNVYYNLSDPVLDTYGALFREAGTGVEVNLWGNSANNYSLYVWKPTGGYTTADVGGTLNVTTVPDGGLTAMLLGMGMLSLGWVRRMAK